MGFSAKAETAPVLTLLLLEYGFGVIRARRGSNAGRNVLTLLLLEYGFGVIRAGRRSQRRVLTLLLLEYGFGAKV